MAHATPTRDLELLAAYRRWQRWRNLSEDSTVTKYGQTHRAWVAWLHARELTLATARPEDVVAFVEARRASPRSRYHYLSRLAALHRWLVDEGHAPADPTAKVARPQVPHRVPRPIATTDLAEAMRTAIPRTRAFMALAALAGLRCKEISGLHVEDLYFDADIPTLVVSAPKGLRERVVPLHPEIRSALSVYGLPASGFVFPYWTNPGRPIRAHTVSHSINTHLHDLGIAATAHSLRSWFATNVYGLSRDLRMVQDLLGHASPSTTALYVKSYAAGAAPFVAELSL